MHRQINIGSFRIAPRPPSWNPRNQQAMQGGGRLGQEIGGSRYPHAWFFLGMGSDVLLGVVKAFVNRLKNTPTPRVHSLILHRSRPHLLQHRISCLLGRPNTHPTFRLRQVRVLQIRTIINDLVHSTGRILFHRLPSVLLRREAQCCKFRTTRIRIYRRRRQTLHRMERASRHTRPATWVTHLNLTAQTRMRFRALTRTRSQTKIEVGETVATSSLWEMWTFNPSKVSFAHYLFLLRRRWAPRTETRTLNSSHNRCDSSPMIPRWPN